MKRTYSWILFLLGLCICTGCMRDETERLPASGHTFTVHYSFDDMQTRAVAAESNENLIKDIAFIYYKEEDETYVAHQSVSVSTGGASGSFVLSVPGEIETGERYKVLVIGNYSQFKPDGVSLDDYMNNHQSDTYTQMQTDIYSQTASQGRIATPLPFNGILLGTDGSESLFTGPEKDATSLGVSIRFSRSVSRIDLRHMAADRLVIAWAKVCNYRDKGYLFHNDAPAGDLIRGTAIKAPTEGAYPAGYVKLAPPTSGDKRQAAVNGGLYAYTNIVPYAAQDDKNTTFLMIAGYFQKEGEMNPNTTKLTYYRANIAVNGKSQVLKRNYVYTIVINNVKKEGADSEEGAATEKEQLLDYAVDDSWEDNENGTVTDDAGNFLTVSRTSVVMESPAGEAALIKVSVKKGTGWKLNWNSNLEDAFRYELVDENSFNIITTGVNNTLFTRNAKLDVTVTGVTPEPANPLTIQINVTQLSSVSDPRILMVEGKTGDFDYTVPGQGSTVSLQVLTGSATARWKATGDNNLNQFVSSYQNTGAHKGYVVLTFQPNVSDVIRSGTLTLERMMPDGATVDTEVSPVHVTFSQDKSPYVVTLTPSYNNSPLVIDGFSDEDGNVNGVSVSKGFQVLLADPTKYTFKAESSFNGGTDAFLSLGNPQNLTAVAHKVSPSSNNTLTGNNGQTFFLNVFRTGPGDADIKGTILVTAVPKNAEVDAPAEFSFTVIIKSSCKIGDSHFTINTGEKYLATDRNVGAIPKIGDYSAVVGLNYSADTQHNDNANSGFQGRVILYADLQSECTKYGKENYTGTEVEGWMAPTKTIYEQLISQKRYRFSKQRVFILSEEKTSEGNNIGCYLPVSHFYSANYVAYITSTDLPMSKPCAWILSMNGSGLFQVNSSVYVLQSTACDLRCFKKVN